MSTKRKRAPTLDDTKTIGLDAVQPSSRDASEEDAVDPVLEQVRESRANGGDSSGNGNSNGAASKSAHPAKRSKSNGNGNEGDEPSAKGENGEAGTMRMADPPKAGMVDPVGYHTNQPPEGRPVRIYADGVFDLFHLGHMRQLQQAKTAFPNVHLIVGVTGDKETHKRKGLTVLSGKERADSVRHCRWVDEVIEDCPWIIDVGFIDKHKIDYVAHDDIPYGASEGDDIYAPIKKAGKFLVTQRTEGLSTTGIITKIVRDYDQYIARQLKRGTSRQELNVSWLKKNELDMKRNLSELRNNIKTNWTSAGQELGRELQKFWVGAGGGSRPASPAASFRAGFDFGSSRNSRDGDADTATSPVTAVSPGAAALSRMSHLDIPSSGSRSSDFAAGYSLGLLGGVRSWMSKSKRTLNDDASTRPHSPSSASSDGDKSPKMEPQRGRRSKSVQDEVDAQVGSEMNSPLL